MDTYRSGQTETNIIIPLSLLPEVLPRSYIMRKDMLFKEP